MEDKGLAGLAVGLEKLLVGLASLNLDNCSLTKKVGVFDKRARACERALKHGIPLCGPPSLFQSAPVLLNAIKRNGQYSNFLARTSSTLPASPSNARATARAHP